MIPSISTLTWRPSPFDGDLPLRINEAPPIEVPMVASREEPGGLGRTGVPPMAPTVASTILPPPDCAYGDCPLALNLEA